MKLFENDWLGISHLLLKMYSEKTSRLFDNSIMHNLKYMIPYDKATFWLRSSDDDTLLCSPEGINFDVGELQSRQITLAAELPQIWVHFYEKCTVVRDSDFSNELSPQGQMYYADLLTNHNIKYAMTILLCHKEMPVGVLTLFREKGRQDFSDKEIYIAEQLMEHIACYCYDIYNIGSRQASGSASADIDRIAQNYKLSLRELEVLKCVLEGKNASAICEALRITESTEKKHLSSIYKKMNIKSKTELFKILLS